MTDAWERFAERSGGAEVAGYFEQGPDRSGASGVAASFVRADAVRSLDRKSDPAELARFSDRFLDRHRAGGILGYAGFDAVGLFESALGTFPVGSPFPLGEFAYVPELDVHRVRAPAAHVPGGRRPGRPIHDSMPRRRYERAVGHLRRAIRDGEAFQVVLAHRRSWPRPDDLLARAGELRASERYAFFYYLRFGDREIVGASPESVAEVDRDRAQVDPIAGTTWPGSDRGSRPALEVDPKELAEHRMLVDLARNDLGGISRPGSVHLVWEERRMRYARLDHLVSRVAGRLRPGVGPWGVLAATFPAGTVSGAPKIRATELLRREEATWRGPYAGAVGLLRRGPRAAWALTIRTAFASGRRLYTAAGAGIVYRSRPAQEFRETLAKLAVVEERLVGQAA